MKLQKTSLVLGLFLGISSAYAASIDVYRESQTVEVPLETLVAPYHGYDNKNNVEVVLHGSLPNACYRLSKYTVERSQDRRKIRIHQYAVRNTDGVCAEEALPIHLNMTVPFTNVVSLGSMAPGDYTFAYQSADDVAKYKTLNVKEAHKTTMDDFPYAAVSNASVSDVIQKNEKLSVTLSGVFTSSCAYLDNESVKVEKQKDVYVVLPVVKMKTGVYCLQTLIPFTQSVEMEAPKASGHYLVHVRSMNGKSVNRIVQALE